MAHDNRFRISLLNAAGLYLYTDPKNGDNTYTVHAQSDPIYLKHLPIDWMNTELTWSRNTTYWGVFRSYSKTYQFVEDARAILNSLWMGAGGANAYCRMVVEIFNEADFTYSVFFDSEIDFSTCKDGKQKKALSASTLDARLQMLLKAKSATSRNIPFWSYDSGAATWSTDAVFAQHNGIKLLYNSTFDSGATIANPLSYGGISGVQSIYGFDNGNHGSSQGKNTRPAMYALTITQNNGATTYIGNDILQPVLIQGTNQNSIVNNTTFTDDNGNPYMDCLLKNLLDVPIELNVKVSGTFSGHIFWDDGGAGIDKVMSFVLFPLDQNNNSSFGMYPFNTILDIPLTGGTSPISTITDFSGSAVITLQPQTAFIFGIIYDHPPGGEIGGGLNFTLTALTVSFLSNYNSGTAGPVPAPLLPPNTFIARRPGDLWNKLIKTIDSTTTDAYGFPVIVGAYSGTSTFLNDATVSAADNFDMIPHSTLYTSKNAIKYIWGQPYIALSIADFFTTWFNVNGCGMGLEGNNLRIEKLSYFLDKTTEILALGSDISGFEIEQMTELMANHIKAGYNAPQTNNNYGVDEFNIPQDYDAPLDVMPGELNLAASAVTVGMYGIEKERAVINDGTVSNPSADNATILLQVKDTTSSSQDIQDPGGVIHSVTPYDTLQYPTAQSTDPTAATAPYIKGLYYPDTAINTGMTPAKNTMRNGPLLHSLCDQLDSKVLTYTKQYQQLYTDPLTALTLPGISSNISAGLIDEVADIPISSLGDKLFRPYFFKFTATYPNGMYALINSNPYGYVSFIYVDENNQATLYKGFIWEVKQHAGNNASTNFTLIAHPDMTDAELGIG